MSRTRCAFRKPPPRSTGRAEAGRRVLPLPFREIDGTPLGTAGGRRPEDFRPRNRPHPVRLAPGGPGRPLRGAARREAGRPRPRRRGDFPRRGGRRLGPAGPRRARRALRAGCASPIPAGHSDCSLLNGRGTRPRSSSWPESRGPTGRRPRRCCSKRFFRGVTEARAFSGPWRTEPAGARWPRRGRRRRRRTSRSSSRRWFAKGLAPRPSRSPRTRSSLERVAGCRFDVAVFTNLTRDHLDFHGDMESYYQAKKRLFGMRKEGASAVVNVDDRAGRRLASEIAPPVVTFSASGGETAAVRAVSSRCDLSGTSLDVRHGSSTFAVASPLLGRFQVENLLGAAAAGIALGMPESDIAAALASVRRVPGRLEPVEAGQPFPILVDYAHTEDALDPAAPGGPRADRQEDRARFRLRGRPRQGQAHPDGPRRRASSPTSPSRPPTTPAPRTPRRSSPRSRRGSSSPARRSP